MSSRRFTSDYRLCAARAAKSKLVQQSPRRCYLLRAAYAANSITGWSFLTGICQAVVQGVQINKYLVTE